MKKIGILSGIVTAILLTASAFAGTLADGGEYYYVGGGAKEISLGFTGISELGSIEGASINPAALGDIRRVANSFSLGGFGTSNTLVNLGFAMPSLTGNYFINLHYLTSSYGTGYKNLVGGDIGIAKAITEKLFWGFSLKLDYGNVLVPETDDWQLGFDMGIIRQVTTEETGTGFLNPSWGVVLKNIGKTLQTSTNNSYPGTGIGGGFSFTPVSLDSYQLKLLADVNLIIDIPFTNQYVGFVGSIGMENTLFNLLNVRAAYNLNTYGIPSIALGGGISGAFLIENTETDIDLAYALLMEKNNNTWALSHTVGLNIAWGYYDDKAPEVTTTPNVVDFSPNHDGSRDEVVLELNIDDNQMVDSWEVEIQDDSGNTVKTIKSVEKLKVSSLSFVKFVKQIAGKKEQVEIPETVSWDGNDEDGNIVSDGNYVYILRAWDENKNLGETTAGNIKIDTVIPEIEAEPEFVLFSPNNDGAKDELTFSLKGQNFNDEDTITASLINENGDIVRTYNYTKEIPDEIIWDGLDDVGTPVAEGSYTFEIEAADSAGNSTVQTIAELRLITNYQQVTAEINNEAFSPNSDGNKDNIIFKPAVSDSTGLEAWTISIKDADGNVAHEITGEDTLPEEIVWNGQDDNDASVADGVYYYTLELKYDSGNHPVTEPVEITLDTTPPDVEIEPEFLEFSPNWDGNRDTLKFTHQLDGNPDDTIQTTIEDEYGNLVYFGKYTIETFPETFEWDGLDRNLLPLSEGLYTYKIKTTDSVGNTKEIEVANITLKTGLEQVKIQSDVLAFSPSSETANPQAVFTPEVTSTEGITKMKLEIMDDNDNVIRTIEYTDYTEEIIWDGNDDKGYQLPDGDYSYVMSVEYNYGDNPVTTTKSISIDTVPPTVFVAANYMAFSPNGDDNHETVTIAQLTEGDEDDTFTMTVYDEADNIVDIYIWDGAAPEELVWDGTGTDGNDLPAGYYTFELNAVDNANNSVTETVANVKLVRDFETLEFSGSSAELSPNDDGTFDEIVFNSSISSSEGLEESTLKIIDSMGNVVKNYTSTLPQETITWDGISDTGQQVTDGTYTATMTYQFDSGNTISQTIDDIIVDKTAPTYELTVTPSLFTPDDDGENDTLYINLNLDDPNSITEWGIGIYKDTDDWETSTPIKTFSGTGAVDEVLEWDGYADNGIDTVESVQDYVLVLTASDGLGNSLTDVEKNINVGVLIEVTPEGLRIRISSITFGLNSSTLSSDSELIVDKVIYIIRKILSDPEKYGITEDYSIEVSGHTDDTGSDSYNQTLSEKRALSVYDYLIEQDVDADILTYEGNGETLPFKEITDDMDAETKSAYRAMNRRVEFFIRR